MWEEVNRVEHHVSKKAQVARRVARMKMAFIFPKDHVQDPVQAVPERRRQQAVGLRGDGRDEIRHGATAGTPWR